MARRAYVSFVYDISEKTANTLLETLGKLIEKGFDEVYLLLSSAGGSGLASVALYNILRGLPVKLITHAVGPIDSASIATFLAGEERYASAHSRFFVHTAFYYLASGTRLDEYTIQDHLKALVDFRATFTAVIKERTSLSATEAEKLILEPSPKDPLFAKQAGIINDIREVSVPRGAPMFSFRLNTQPKKEENNVIGPR